MGSNSKPALTSSAELTAYWRCQEPGLSHDSDSIHLVSKEAVVAANRFKVDVYPSIERHLAVRSRFFLDRSVQLVRDLCLREVVSLGSGFSLLTSYVGRDCERTIKVFDIDTPLIIEERRERIERSSEITGAVRVCLDSTVSLGIEISMSNDELLIEFFQNLSSPLFILEGVTYYLDHDSLAWILSEFARYNRAAIILDYWPSDAGRRSSVFRKMTSRVSSDLREDIQNQFLDAPILKATAGDRAVLREDADIGMVEQCYLAKDDLLLTVPDEIIPTRFAILTVS